MSLRVMMRPRRALVRVHRWLALGLLAWVAVISVTGAWLVFNDAFESRLHPDRYDAGRGDRGPAAAIATVEDALPEDGYVYYVTLPVNGRGVYQVFAAWPDAGGPEGEAYATYYVDPSTARINDRMVDDEGFTAWMYRGHMQLWQDHGIAGVFDPQSGWCRAGADGHEPGGVKGVVCDVIPGGEDMIAWMAVAWIVVLLSGFYLWYWPGVRRWATAFAVRRGRGRFAFHMSLHKAVGLVVWVPLVVIASTGAAFAFPNLKGWYENATPAGRDAELWVPPEDAVSVPDGDAEPLDATEFVARVAERYPERRIDSIAALPEDETGTWQAWVDRGFSPWTREGGGGNTLVVMDQYTGKVLYDGTPEEGNVFEQAWSDWSFPLHTGDWAGTPGRTIWLAVALSPLVLGVTGLTMWLVRRSKRRRAAARRVAAVTPDEEPAGPADAAEPTTVGSDG
jgi:uncharacterized iron-regulated membrane protein